MKIESKQKTIRQHVLDQTSGFSSKRNFDNPTFARSEDGSLIVFGLVLFVLMCMIGGIAVDVMRYEQRRTNMQQTLDRSVLAAASMTQELDAESVVNDYFTKADLVDELDSVTVDSGLNYRIVTGSASSPLEPIFMHMIGVDEMDVSANSTAEQRISNVEVSLVLDISGSMSGSRINNLRPAAREFVTSVLGTAEPGRVSLSIVPYNAQVNIGKTMMDAFNVTDNHAYSACMELPDSVFSTNELSRSTSFKQNAHFDPYYTRSGSNNLLYNCPPETGNVVTPLTYDETTLHNAINNLVVGGNTSIDLGVKWGAYLLNKNSNGVIQHMVQNGKVDSVFNDRPLDPATADVLKVLVVMTDGKNTTEYKINDPYNSGNSNIYKNKSNGRISVYFDISRTSNDWWWPRTNSWESYKDGGGSDSNYDRLTWPEVWNDYSVSYVANYFYARALSESFTTWYYRFVSYVSSSKNSRMQQICSAAKANNIVVYGIGFEVPDQYGRDQLRACASTESHYFDASGLEISTAFRAIANNISQLRLTQ